MIAIQQLLAALAVTAVIGAPAIDGKVAGDLGALLIATLLGVVYLEFMTFVVAWYGDLPEKAAWFLKRAGLGWIIGSDRGHCGRRRSAVRNAAGAARSAAAACGLRIAGGLILFGTILHFAWLLVPAFDASSRRDGVCVRRHCRSGAGFAHDRIGTAFGAWAITGGAPCRMRRWATARCRSRRMSRPRIVIAAIAGFLAFVALSMTGLFFYLRCRRAGRVQARRSSISFREPRCRKRRKTISGGSNANSATRFPAMAGSIDRRASSGSRSRKRCGSSPPAAIMPMIRSIRRRAVDPAASNAGNPDGVRHEMRALFMLAFALWPAAAWAGLTEQQIGQVALAPPPGARVPAALVFKDLEGRDLTLGDAIARTPDAAAAGGFHLHARFAGRRCRSPRARWARPDLRPAATTVWWSSVSTRATALRCGATLHRRARSAGPAFPS